jgi:hypothetical protein
MNPKFFGDSYDLVKRFFCLELLALGYAVTVDPMFTGEWNGAEGDFYHLLGVEAGRQAPSSSSRRRALFLDPDTGVNAAGGKQHVSFDRLVHETEGFELVFSFDQSFSRQADPGSALREKLAALRARGCHAMYYESHARFLFAARARHPIDELREHLVSLGLPASRLIEGGS